MSNGMLRCSTLWVYIVYLYYQHLKKNYDKISDSSNFREELRILLHGFISLYWGKFMAEFIVVKAWWNSSTHICGSRGGDQGQAIFPKSYPL